MVSVPFFVFMDQDQSTDLNSYIGKVKQFIRNQWKVDVFYHPSIEVNENMKLSQFQYGFEPWHNKTQVLFQLFFLILTLHHHGLCFATRMDWNNVLIDSRDDDPLTFNLLIGPDFSVLTETKYYPRLPDAVHLKLHHGDILLRKRDILMFYVLWGASMATEQYGAFSYNISRLFSEWDVDTQLKIRNLLEYIQLEKTNNEKHSQHLTESIRECSDTLCTRLCSSYELFVNQIVHPTNNFYRIPLDDWISATVKDSLQIHIMTVDGQDKKVILDRIVLDPESTVSDIIEPINSILLVHANQTTNQPRSGKNQLPIMLHFILSLHRSKSYYQLEK